MSYLGRCEKNCYTKLVIIMMIYRKHVWVLTITSEI